MRVAKIATVAALVLGLATLVACDRKDGGYGRSGTRDRTDTTRTQTQPDISWLVQAADANLTEIEAGRLAETKAASSDVRQFGQHMVEDHSKAQSELSDLAAKKGLTLPTRPEEKHQKSIADLAEQSGAEFDRKFADMMVTDHEKAVSLFESNAKDAKDSDVKAFADKTLPTLRHHLQMARDLKNKLSGTPKAD